MRKVRSQQHLVPICYLNGFLSSEIPLEHLNNPFFEKGIWITDSKLLKSWKQKSPKNILKKLHYYNLPTDINEHSSIEEFLGKLETQYTPIRKKLETQQTLLINEIYLLAMFTMTLQLRVEAFQNHFQSIIDQVENWHRLIDKNLSGNEEFSDRLFIDSKWIAKKMILNLNFAQMILDQGIQFIVNTTDEIFITSDSPVVHSMRHIDEIAAITGNVQNVDTKDKTNEKFPLTLLPITPQIMLIASRFLREGETFPYIYCSDKDSIFKLNLLTLYNANEFLLSSKENPFGINEVRIAEVIQNGEISPEFKGEYLMIYTDSNRYLLRLTNYEHIENGIEFFTSDLTTLEKISKDNYLVSVIIYKDGNEMGGMQKIKFGRLDLTGKTSTIIKHSFSMPSF